MLKALFGFLGSVAMIGIKAAIGFAIVIVVWDTVVWVRKAVRAGVKWEL